MVTSSDVTTSKPFSSCKYAVDLLNSDLIFMCLYMYINNVMALPIKNNVVTMTVQSREKKPVSEGTLPV